MKILINDPLAQDATEELKRLLPDAEIESKHYDGAELLAKVADVDVLIVRSATKATKEVIDAGKNLKIIGRAGMGLDNVDKAAAEARGIKVLNTPGANSLSVAELVLSMILSIYRFIPRATEGMKNGKWEKKELEGFELTGKTVGIIGFGNIGKLVAKLLAGFNNTIVVYDVFDIPADVLKEYNAKQLPLEEIIKTADIMTFHVPKTDKTAHFISDDQFNMMKDGVVIVNAARGGIIDEEALIRALENGKVFGAGLDVFEEEPPKSEIYKKLFNLPNVVLTPHVGASTAEAQTRVGFDLVDRVVKAIKG